jgi:two-component system response regulator HupR/HoxA
LRERTADLMPIAKKLLDDARLELDLPDLHFADDALASLIGYPWPGNIRELRNEIYRAAALSEGAQIGAHSFSWRVMQGQSRNTNDLRLSPPTGTLQEQLDAIEATILKESLLRHRWNKPMRPVNWACRAGLRQKLRRLGLEEAR